jgi:uncharacterized protein (TIGR00369 family)
MPEFDELSAFAQASGFRLREVSPTRVTGWIDLGPEHHQPHGLVHGGVYCAAVETAASVGAAAAAAMRDLTAVGVHNSTNFLRPISAGRVDVVATPIQQGRTQQLWNVDITDADGRLVATGQVRLHNVPLRD